MMAEWHLGTDVFFHGGQRDVHGVHDALGNHFVRSEIAAQFAHAGLGTFAVLDVRRLVAGRAAPRQHKNFFAVSLFHFHPHLAPVITGKVTGRFSHLRGAGDIQHAAGQFLFCVPEKEHFNPRILGAFHAEKGWNFVAAVHLRRAAAEGRLALRGAVHHAAVGTHHRVAKAPTDTAGRAVCPRRLDGRRDFLEHEIHVSRRLQHAFVVHGVPADGARDRAGVRVGGVKKKFFRVKAGQPAREHFTQTRLKVIGDEHQIARNHDGLFERLLALARFNRQHRGGARRLYSLGNAFVKLPRQGDRLLRRDAGHRPTDMNLTGRRCSEGGCGRGEN